MRQLVLTISFFAILFSGFAQRPTGRKALNRYLDGVSYFEMGDYPAALQIFAGFHKENPQNPEINYYLGTAHLALHPQSDSVIHYLEVAVDGGCAPAYLSMAKALHTRAKFQPALVWLEAYLKSDLSAMQRYVAEQWKARIQLAQRHYNDPLDMSIQNIGPHINTEYDEYVPLVAADESMLLFTSKRPWAEHEFLDPLGQYFEDVYMSQFEETKWTTAQPLGNQINTELHDACVGLSSDASTLLLFRTSDELVSGDLYYSKYVRGKWLEPVKFGPAINSAYNEASACFSQDGRTLYFSSDRPGGYGGLDLYRSVLFGNGDWSQPINLGPVVNSKDNEDAPFVHPVDSILYFASQGHQSMGGYDIFSVRQIGVDHWNDVQNMGYPVNTVGDDLFFMMNLKSDKGYFSSSRNGGFGGQDIYYCDLYEYAQPELILKGAITSKGLPVKVKIMVNDTAGHTVGIYRSNAVTGKYLMILQPKQRYVLRIEQDGFIPYQREISYQLDDTRMEQWYNIELAPNEE